MPKKLLKNVSFRDNDGERELYNHAGTKRNFSEWVKVKLEEDMRGTPVAEKIEVDDGLF